MSDNHENTGNITEAAAMPPDESSANESDALVADISIPNAVSDENRDTVNQDEQEEGDKRPNEAAADEQSSANKRQKKSCVTDDLICPITHELPFDPVTALDGRVYERSAMEMHIETCQGGVIRSPITNEPISDVLLPAPQTKNVIQTLIDNGVITGDLVTPWNAKVKEQENMEELLRKAEAGDKNAMYMAANHYAKGVPGFKKDFTLAFKWYKKAHQAGSIKATTHMALGYLYGRGVETNAQLGAMYLGLAAGKGSAYAAFRLGLWLDNPHDQELSIHWWQVSLSPECSVKDLECHDEKMARDLLRVFLQN